jgi:hypothetical protein
MGVLATPSGACQTPPSPGVSRSPRRRSRPACTTVRSRCSFETALTHFDLTGDSVLEEIGRIVHEADLADDTFDAPAAPGLDVLIRGLTLTSTGDQDTLAMTDRLFDGLYEHIRQRLLTGRPPA